jgi:tetratricopeptide (TPR) repeat protein
VRVAGGSDDRCCPAQEAAKLGNVEDAARLELEALQPLQKAGRKGGPRKWLKCDESDGYGKVKHGLAHFRLAVALQAQGSPVDALHSFELARDFDGGLEADARLNMGLLYLELGQLDDAESQLQKVIRNTAKEADKKGGKLAQKAAIESASDGVLGAMAALGEVRARVP